jgi:glycine dehydrogenase
MDALRTQRESTTPPGAPAAGGGAPLAERFVDRHVGPDEREVREMLGALGLGSLDELVEAAVPAAIRSARPLALEPARSEHEALREVAERAAENRVTRAWIGMGYHDCVVPPVLVRNVLENPGWYTQYTAYQAEISQGRLEALLNYQTMVADLTGLEVANASLLDEATAAAEAMAFALRVHPAPEGKPFLADSRAHPQTLAVLATRAEALGLEVVVGEPARWDLARAPFGVLVQYPTTDGLLEDPAPLLARAAAAGAVTIVAADLLALTLVRPPGELGAEVAIGSTQRFGVPLGFGGPHAAYFAARERHKRALPGRIVGVSKDRVGRPALRLALQTREQHIRREKATSNICTAQVLLAVMAGCYAVWHGPEGLRGIAMRLHRSAAALAALLRERGFAVRHARFFDTLRVDLAPAERERVRAACSAAGIELRAYEDGLGIALDERVEARDLAELLACFDGAPPDVEALEAFLRRLPGPDFGPLAREGAYLTHPVFHAHRSETEMMRYLERLRSRDLSLVHSMIPLGSCTMKLNAAAEMLPITLPGFSRLHPFAPPEQGAGYRRLFRELESWLLEITGFAAVSLQPNAGSQGEYAGLLVIRAWHRARGDEARDVCLIPQSAHGTNPASAAMAGMRVVVVGCDERGNVDLADLRAKCAQHAGRLAALMLTYPSTHGVFEAAVKDICAAVHRHGGQVYMDGANLNALVGIARPAELGADVCHINLHKTFCIPHGGGGPGMGPIAVAAHLAPYLPGHPVVATGGEQAIGAVAAAPWSSASILPIPWMYVRMMGPDGLTRATQVAILSANYVAHRLSEHFPILYRGEKGFVAHECIVDVRPLKKAGIEVEDVAKRLMDFGFHAPTMSFPVAGTLMVEPTESESKDELDRFCDALAHIAAEARAIERGELDPRDNPLKNAPHTLEAVTADEWTHPYSRAQAAFPAPWVRERKFWPSVARVDNAWGDKHLVCSCPPVEAWR